MKGASLENIFKGKFFFDRYISEKMMIKGSAEFNKSNNKQLNYKEKGNYLANGQKITFSQSRIFVLEKSILLIYDSQMKLLHKFYIPNMILPINLNHTYYCKNDIYKVTLDITNHQKFSISYLVMGPQKKYKILTNYHKI